MAYLKKSAPKLRLENTGAGVGDFSATIDATNGYFAIRDEDTSVDVVRVYQGQPLNSLVLRNSKVGIGINPATGRWHVFGIADEVQQIIQGNGTQNANLSQWLNSAGTELVRITNLGGFVFNESGADADCRIEGDNDANLFCTDASTDSIGEGTAAPASFHDFKAATTSRASIRVPAGTAPTVPGEGDAWNDNVQKVPIIFVNAIKQALVGTIFTQTASVTVSNNSAETTLVGAGIGTATLPANFLVAGKTIRIVAGGFYGTDAVAPNNVLRIKLGSTTILASSADNLTAGIGNDRMWYMEAIITCRSTGAGGTVIGQGHIDYWTGGSTNKPYSLQNLAVVAVNTTGALAVDVTADWNVADTDNTITMTNFAITILN